MNWTKASAVAEILSSAAVLITLIYLVVESTAVNLLHFPLNATRK